MTKVVPENPLKTGAGGFEDVVVANNGSGHHFRFATVWASAPKITCLSQPASCLTNYSRDIFQRLAVAGRFPAVWEDHRCNGFNILGGYIGSYEYRCNVKTSPKRNRLGCYSIHLRSGQLGIMADARSSSKVAV